MKKAYDVSPQTLSHEGDGAQGPKIWLCLAFALHQHLVFFSPTFALSPSGKPGRRHPHLVRRPRNDPSNGGRRRHRQIMLAAPRLHKLCELLLAHIGKLLPEPSDLQSQLLGLRDLRNLLGRVDLGTSASSLPLLANSRCCHRYKVLRETL